MALGAAVIALLGDELRMGVEPAGFVVDVTLLAPRCVVARVAGARVCSRATRVYIKPAVLGRLGRGSLGMALIAELQPEIVTLEAVLRAGLECLRAVMVEPIVALVCGCPG